jgi:Arc/MetJ-type ribon-helix-helix transcriptional regulator
VFDNAPKKASDDSNESADRLTSREDERIALRCNRKELQLLDSFVSNGEFASRSELMREALRSFLRARALSATPPARVDPTGIVEIPVRLRSDELETLGAYARLVGNDRPLGDVLAEFVRRAELELKVVELVQRARSSVQQAAEQRAQVGALQESARDLERKGVVGR